jgi:hypothetical protein
MVHPIGVRSLDEMARSRRGVIPPGSTVIHIGGIYNRQTMNYLQGLTRSGYPVIVLHTGREEPPDYPDFEVRDGRELFLERRDDSGENDFKRPSQDGGDWSSSSLTGRPVERGSE